MVNTTNRNFNSLKISGIAPEAMFIPDGVKANCYLFALAPKIGVGGYANRMSKSRPGDKCPHNKLKNMSFSDCRDINSRVTCDNKSNVRKLASNFKQVNISNIKDRSGKHLMIAVLSPGYNGTSQDFHFLRRINVYDVHPKILKKIVINSPMKTRNQLYRFMKNGGNNVWFHQRGWSHGGPLMYDAKNNLITNPKKSNFNYGRLNYSKTCGLFNVNSRHATVNSTYNKPSSIARKRKWIIKSR